ncbi:rubrerythrin family protein [bacterium]|nr:rubrerythrin family protein [bacterium]
MSKLYDMIAAAYVGESQARNRYTFYASVARKEGYEAVAAVFAQTADQEKQHAKTFYQFLVAMADKEGRAPKVAEGEVFVRLSDTMENLRGAIAGENEEATAMYQEIAAEAMSAGEAKIAARVKAIAEAEAHHRDRYQKLLEHLEAGEMFEQVSETVWVCRECGYRFVGKAAPKMCPSCEHPQAFFEREQLL